jgi:NAD(P)-dependent dehydrogenase (short-subunit alcohol dehydrogenase family)
MEENLLANRTAIVTGAGSGIGRAAALLFALNGARVVAVDLDPETGRETVEDIGDAGGSGLFVRADVSRGEDVAKAVRRAVKEFERLDVIFNVVGVSGRRWGDGPVHECTEEGWDRVLETNLKSVYLCCKHAVAEMLKSGGGSIVNLSSVLGLVGGDEDFGTHAYAASKGAIISLTRAIASFYATHGIRANVICPSLIATPMSRRAQADAAIRARLPSLQPLTGDFGRPMDVAHAALFLASDRAAFITGAVLPVDGGWTCR